MLLLAGSHARFDNRETSIAFAVVQMGLYALMSAMVTLLLRVRTTVFGGDAFVPCTGAPVDS